MSDSQVMPKKEKSFHLRWPAFLTDRNSAFYYYLVLVATGIIFFAVSLFSNYFTTPFTGDYVSQQYAFYTNGYDDWWHFFKTGEFVLYDTNTFLGASNIGSNSFYYLFDPFFMPILLFPRSWIPQGIAIMTIFKMALAGLTFSIYMKYLGVKKYTARLAGLMYAFCGWTTWYLWFNHFTGVAVIFPVILLGVEKVLSEKKPWLLSLSLFILGLTNFFFFFTFTVCAFLYAMFRFFQRVREYGVKQSFIVLGIGFFGFAVGCLLATFVVIPAMMVALNAPRAAESTYLSTLLTSVKEGNWGKFFYYVFSWESQNTPYKVYYPILDYIFPVMSDRGTPLTKLGTETYDNVAGSLFCFSPVILFFVPALISSTKKKHFSPLIATVLFLFMLFTPFCYFAFHGFTYAYSRWTLFVTTSLIAYVAFYIDDIEHEPRWHVVLGGIVTLVTAFAAILIAVHMANKYDNFKLRYVYNNLGDYGFLTIEGVVYAVYVIILVALIYLFLNKKKLKAIFTFAVMAEAALMGALTLNGHGYENFMNVNGGYKNNNDFQSLIEDIKEDDPTYYRCYSSQENSSARNDSMRHDYNGLGMFHSVYNYNTAAFLNWSQINDYTAPSSYSASYVEKRQDLDTFLGVKYYFVHKDKAFWGNNDAKALKSEYYRANVPIGFVDISSQYPNDSYYVYKNANFIDFAFSFDHVATYVDVDEEGKKKEPSRILSNTYQTEELYLRTAIIGESNLKYVEGLISEHNIREASLYKHELDVRTLGSNKYKITYYDIHEDADTGRTDASSYNFVSKLLDLSEYKSTAARPTQWKYNGRYVAVVDLYTDLYDEEGIALYVKNTYLNTMDINMYLVTEDEEGNERFLTFDNHNDSNLSNNWTSRKQWRGIYSAPYYDLGGNKYKAPKISKIIIVSRKTEMTNYDFAYKTGTEINNLINTLKEYPVTDIHYSTNHFDFKTNYESPRVVVTQLPYEDGFILTATTSDGTKKEKDIFTAQGGFVAFVSEVGETSYSLDFYTPYLKPSSYLSILGLFLFATSAISYIYISINWNIEDTKKDRDFARKTTKNPIF